MEPFSPRDDLDFEDLFKKYAPRIRAIALNRTCDRQLAEDVVQETLIKAYRYQGALDRSRPVWPWLLTIASNSCNDLMRGASRHAHRSLSEISEPEKEIPLRNPDPADRYAEQEILGQALEALNSRHRRILLLSSEGWNYRDIADLEGISFFAVQSALQRARRRFRDIYTHLAIENGHSQAPSGKLGKNGLPSILLVPQLVTEWARRIRQRMKVAGNQAATHLSNASSFTASSLSALFDTVIAALVVTTVAVGSGGGRAPAVVSPTTARTAAVASMSGAQSEKDKPNTPTLASAPVAVAQTFAHGAINEINPYSEKTPEQTWFRSVVASPNYENDRTVFASGTCNIHSTCNALWISRDGGASWERLPARNFLGGPGQILLSPNWNTDGRIYSYDWKGIQLSTDGGESWMPTLLLPWEISRAALSPHYSADDRRLVLSTGLGLMDYWPETGRIKVAETGLTGSNYRLLGSSPTHAAEIAIHLSDGAGLHECSHDGCRLMSTLTEVTRAVQISPSSGFWNDGLLLGLDSQYRIVVEADGTMRRADDLHKFSNGGQRGANRVLVVGSSFGPPMAIASLSAMDYDGIYRSHDDGATWTPSLIKLAGFEWGVEAIGSTPSGRIFAGGRLRGIACSEDGGFTWAARCSPE